MAKKKFSSFQEEFEYDYHRHKKIAKFNAWVRLIQIGVILIGCIVLLIICTTQCTNNQDILNNLNTVSTLG